MRRFTAFIPLLVFLVFAVLSWDSFKASGPSLDEFVRRSGTAEESRDPERRRAQLESAEAAFRGRGTNQPSAGDAQYEMGRAWHRRKKFDEALASLDEAIRLDPRHAPAHHERGLVLFARGQPALALEAFEVAYRLDSTFVEALLCSGRMRAEIGNRAAAVKDFDRVIELRPGLHEAYHHRGVARGFLGDHDGAIRDFSHLIKVDDRDVSAFFNRGIAFRRKGDAAAAIEDFNVVLKREPKNARAYCERALCRERQRAWEEVVKDCDRALACDPEYALAYAIRGNAKFQREDLTGARADYDQALYRRPRDGFFYWGRARVRWAQDDLLGALADCEEAILHHPAEFEAHRLRERLRQDVTETIDVISDYGVRSDKLRAGVQGADFRDPLFFVAEVLRIATAKLAENPREPEALLLRGAMYARLHNEAAALRDLDNLLSAQPDHVAGLAERAFVWIHRREIARAESDLARAFALAPRDARTLAYRAMLRLGNGEREAARKDLDAAINADPLCIVARMGRAGLRSADHDMVGTKADLDRILEIRPGSWMALAWRAPILRAENRENSGSVALTDFDRAVALAGDYAGARVFVGRGRLHAERKNFAQARLDLTRAIELRPDLPHAYAGRAEVNFELGEICASLEDLDRAVAIAAETDQSPIRLRGRIKYATGDYIGAAADFERASAAESDASAYMAFFRVLSLQRARQEPPWTEFMRAVSGWKPGWAKSIGRFLAGELSEEALLHEIPTGDEPPRNERECEAYFYIGTMRLIRGDRAGAKPWFEKAVTTGATHYIEHFQARVELRALQTPAAPEADRSND